MSVRPDFQLGAHTLPYRREPLDRALRGIADAGYDVVGLYCEHDGEPVAPARPTLAEARELRRRVAGFGLEPVTVFARPGATADVDALLADLDLCAAMDVPLLQAFGPTPSTDGQRRPEMAWHGEVERFLDVLRRTAPEAERRGVTIALKPHRGATATGADLVDVLHRVSSPAVRACWDAGNIRFYEGLDSEDDLADSGVAPFVVSVCIKDHAGAAGQPVFPVPGDGQVDHPRLIGTLAAAGFRGPLLVERVDQPTTEATDAALARAHAYLLATVREVVAT